MVSLEDSSKLITGKESEISEPRRNTLLAKYQIPVQHLEFEYIEKCRDGREMEKIVQILRSGEEGYYPELTKSAEDKLAILKPKSKLLRQMVPVRKLDNLPNVERKEIESDLTDWIENVKENDSYLGKFRRKPLDSTDPLPDVREFKPEQMKTTHQKPLEKRISSLDYSSWDKYDPDTEILKMDIQEEKIKAEFLKDEKQKTSTKKSVAFKRFQTDVEAAREATYEKDKGNEFFKSEDYKEALQHYTNSINCKPSAACYTNRALTYFKLKKMRNAVEDCNSALTIEPHNFKAFYRKALALDSLGRNGEALMALESAIGIDPNNSQAQELAHKLRRNEGVVLKNTRFKIEEVDSKPARKKTQQTAFEIDRKNRIIPLPGPSYMSPPHYIAYKDNYPGRIEVERCKLNPALNQFINLVAIENYAGAEEDDGCLINHLAHICTRSRSGKDIKKLVKADIKNTEQNLQLVHKELPKSTEKPLAKATRTRPVLQNDEKGGGEPFIKEPEIEMPDNLHSPFSFLTTWNSASEDATFEQHAVILRNIDMRRITEVVGCKLDSAMFSQILKCLSTHFAVPGEIDRLHCILENLVNLDRFEIISIMMSGEDKNCVKILINFLNQHGRPLPRDVINKLLS